MTEVNFPEEIDAHLQAGDTQKALANLAGWVLAEPENRHARIALAIALGDAGNPAGALKVLRLLADRLAHQGKLLEAMVALRHGLERAPHDPSLLASLDHLHTLGVMAKTGEFVETPPIEQESSDQTPKTIEELTALSMSDLIAEVSRVGCQFPQAGDPGIPLPMPLLSDVSAEMFVDICRRLHYRRVQKGEIILQEDSIGTSVIIVASGHVDIKKGEKLLAKVGSGILLGEMGLLAGSPRTATAIAHEEVEYFELTREELGLAAETAPAIVDHLRDFYHKRLMGNLLATSPLFQKFDDNAQFLVINEFKLVGFKAGDTIIEANSEAKGLYLIATGHIEVSIVDEAGEKVVISNMGPTDVIGEISLLSDQLTTATVKARERVGALFLDRVVFKDIVDQQPRVKAFLEELSVSRLEGSRQARITREITDAIDLIML